MILLSHPTGAGNARHVALALLRAGVLGEVWACPDGAAGPRALELDSPAPIVASAADAVELSSPPRRAEHLCRTLDRTVSSRLACRQFRGVYAYADSAEESFRIAGLRGMLRIYDLADASLDAEHDLCAEEAALEPDWADALAPSRTTQRRGTEMEQADLVFVGSSFLLRMVEQVPGLSTTLALLVPGAARYLDGFAFPSLPAPNGKLRALYVGELDQRKGLSYLFRACRELRNAVELTVIGPARGLQCDALTRALLDVRWRPACSAHQLRAEMATHDVLLAPSVFEGFNPVLLEALAAGLPVIATPHTAGPDLIEHGQEGFIVPVRSSDEIAAKLDLLRREPERLREMSGLARRRAQLHTWARYERTLAASVAAALAGHSCHALASRESSFS
jgi:glycosyltransferase involved in cell wall biosynthesis